MSLLTHAIRLTCLTLAFAAPLSAQEAVPAAEDDMAIDISQISCRDFLKYEVERRRDTIVFLHGYVSGMKKNVRVDIGTLLEATDAALDGCIDQPSASALSVFEAVRK